MGAVVCEENPKILAVERQEAFEFLSYLELEEVCLMEEETTAERVDVVVGTCVYYHLLGPGHDARSRIGSSTCVHFGGSFTLRERQGVVQCWTERQECGHYLDCGGVRSL